MVYKPKNNYFWGEGFKPKVNANIVGAVVEKIEEKDGEVTKESFLEFSRPTKSPTHSLFEWDDSVAAEKYRLGQSKSIIGHLRVTYIDSNGEDAKVNAYVKVTPKGEHPTYQNIHIALQDEEKREVVLERIREELNRFIERNKHIEELAEILIDAGMNIKSA